MQAARLSRTLSIIAIIVLLVLTGCGGKAAPTATPEGSALAGAAQVPSAQAPVAQAPVAQAPVAQAPITTSAPAPTPTRPPLPPTVVSVRPDRGEEQFIAAPVIVTFDQPMDPASTGSAFSIEPNVPGDIVVEGSQLTFMPKVRLERSKEYRITLASNATSSAGLALQGDVSFKFVTAGFLSVSSTQPADGATDVTADSTITVAFNRPVVPLTGAADQDALPQPLVITPTLAGRGTWVNTSMYRFTANNGLAASTTYSVTVAAGLEDTTGGVLAEAHTFSFRTTDPTILRWAPEDSANVRIERPISVTFSMPMDPASTEAAFSLLDPDGAPVAGTFNWNADATEMGFKPSEILKFGARYRAGIGTAAKAFNGEGGLREAGEFAFETVKLPRVQRTEPATGSEKVSPDQSVRIVFASPMNPATFVTDTVTILPKPTRVFTYYNEYENALFVDFTKLPATDYSVRLSAKVSDPYGNTLGEDYLLRFRTGDLAPLMQLNNSQQFGTYSAYTSTQAVMVYRNTPEITFGLYGVEVDDLMRMTGSDSWQAWEAYKPGTGALVREWTRKTEAERNERAVVREPLLDREGNALAPGVYYLQAKSAAISRSEQWPRQLIIRTDLNVTLKASATDALAWVTDLKSGLPVPGVTVRFADGANEMNATTDRNGVAQVTLAKARNPWDSFLAVATGPNGQFGVASVNWQDGISSWAFGVSSGGEMPPYAGYVYTDRPIYRPGQTVYWKAILRRDTDAQYALPAPSTPVTVTINDDQGNTVLQRVMTLNPLGAIDGSLELGPEAGLGYYYINVRLTESSIFGVGFLVAEYRKPEYEISAQTDKPEYVQGEQMRVTAEASYFFGGPVKNAKVRWVLMAADSGFDYRGEGWYSFSDFEWWDVRSGPFGGMISEGEARTDDQGRVSFVVPADVSRYKSSQRFTVDITIQDANNQAVATQASAIVHKGAFYIGLSPRGYVLQAGDEGQVDVLTIDAQSQPVANTGVDLVVSRVEWLSVREQLEDGEFYWVTRPKKTGVLTTTVTTAADGTAVLDWTPTEPGEYKIDASARDARGNTIRSGAYTWVSGPEYVSWRQENNDRIKLVPNKDEYSVGDVAEVLIPSPYQGAVKALVTIERGRILSHQVIELSSNSEVLRLPIERTWTPNVFVSVVIMKGIDEASRSPDAQAPSFKVGLAQLKVSTADKKLQVIVTPRGGLAAPSSAEGEALPQFAPRAAVSWDIQTLDAAGKGVPADVSLALVDKAVLTLASDQAGAILDRFYSERTLGVQTGLTLVLNIDRLIAQLAEDGKGGGGGGDGRGAEVRTEFPDIAYWRASVQTDAAGKATVEVTLPDNLTTWVMDARAATSDTLVGQSSAAILATKDLLVRPVLPRFFVAGDRADIAALIHNTTGRDLDVTYAASATGLTLLGSAADTVTIPAGGTYKAVWSARALDYAERIVFNVRAEAPAAKLSDAVQITLPVERYTSPEVVGTSGQVEVDRDVLELVRLPGNVDTTRGELEVQIEPSLAAGMLGGLTYLEHYPYECVEQTLSRFLPNVITFGALKKLGVERPDLDARLPQQVGVGLQRIYAKQHVDGGWGWWANDKSNATITSYVVFGLARARQADFTVDERVLLNGTAWLRRMLRAPADLKAWELNQQAFMVYALAEAGVKEPNRAGAMFEVRERLDNYAKAYLALALDLIGDDAAKGRIDTLLADLSGTAITSATGAHWEETAADYWNMNTDTRTTAIVLDALARLDPASALGPNTVRWLMSARTANHWETTQDNAWAIIALTDWMAATGELAADYDWQVALNGTPLGEGTVTPQTVQQVATLRAEIKQLLVDQTNGLVLQRTAGSGQTGAGQMYYTAHLKTYLPVADLESLSRGFTVSREYRLAECVSDAAEGTRRDADAACPPITSARVGDVIQVKVTLVAPHSSYYVIVEDPLPAGTEALDTSLRTTSQTVTGPQVGKETAGKGIDSGWWWTPTHVELRDEKAVLFATELEPGTYEFTYAIRASLPGEFLTLPVTAHQMYFPEVWGRGAGGTFVVTE